MNNVELCFNLLRSKWQPIPTLGDVHSLFVVQSKYGIKQNSLQEETKSVIDEQTNRMLVHKRYFDFVEEFRDNPLRKEDRENFYIKHIQVNSII